MTTNRSKTATLVEVALMIALGTILAQIKIFRLPNGGSVSMLSMLPFILVSFRHGPAYGMLAGFANSLLQMLLGFSAPPAGDALSFFGMILLDFVLAFTVLGTASFFAGFLKNKTAGVAFGTAVVCFLRFICSFLSGILIWQAYAPADMPVWLYSLTYNASYMGIELVATTIAIVILFKTAPKIFSK